MSSEILAAVARQMVAPGKGILAADESNPTIQKRFDSINLESTEDNRRVYRQLLFTTERASEFISGVILFDETLRQSTDQGIPFPRLLTEQGILPGIKVDKGAKTLAGAHGEKVTEGLDGLRPALEEYRKLGATFAKWRAVITIGENIPSARCLDGNAHALARFASLSQEAGLVPIVEPEVLMDGSHSIGRCEEVTGQALEAVFSALYLYGVELEGICLKPNMVLSGKDWPERAGEEEVAEATTRCFLRHVPAAVPGIVFLSGGQSEIEATRNLNAMNALGSFPWELSFSYGRALQASALVCWGGSGANKESAQKAFYHRARCNGAARTGSYDASWDRQMA